MNGVAISYCSVKRACVHVHVSVCVAKRESAWWRAGLGYDALRRDQLGPKKEKRREEEKQLGSPTDGAGVVFVQNEQPDGRSERRGAIGGHRGCCFAITRPWNHFLHSLQQRQIIVIINNACKIIL